MYLTLVKHNIEMKNKAPHIRNKTQRTISTRFWSECAVTRLFAQ